MVETFLGLQKAHSSILGLKTPKNLTKSNTVILQLKVENPSSFYLMIEEKCSTGCRRCQMHSQVKTGVELSDFMYYDTQTFFAESSLSSAAQMDRVGVRMWFYTAAMYRVEAQLP